MTGPNTPNGGTEVPTQKPNTAGKPIEVLIQSVTMEKNGGFDPYILNQIEAGGNVRNKTLHEVREAMLATYQEDDYRFEKSEVEGLTDERLRGYIAKYSRGLISLRANILKRIKQAFPDTDINIQHLNEDILQYSENELSNILETPAKMRRYLIDTIGIPRGEIQFWKPKLRALFDPENMPDSDFKNRLMKAIERFEKNNVPFDRELVREIVGYYDRDLSMLEKIGNEFNITLNFQESLRAGVLSTDQIDTFTQEQYRDIWSSLSPEQQNQLKVMMRSDDVLRLSFEELRNMNPNFDRLADSKHFKDLITKELKFQFTEHSDSSERSSLTTSFGEFVQKIEDKKTKINIHPLIDLREGSVMICRERGGKIRFLKIEKIDEELSMQKGVSGMTLSFLDGIAEGTIGQAKGRSTLSYESLEEKLAQMDDIQVMDESEVRTQVDAGMFQDEHGQTLRDASIEEDEYSFDYLKNKLDSVDSAGKNIEIKEGMVFSAKVDVSDEKTQKKSSIVQSFTVLKVDKANKTITFSNSRDVEQASFYEFAKVAESGGGFRRIAIMNSDTDFLHAISGLVEDFPSSTHLKDGKFVPDDHHDDEHQDNGHDGHDAHKKDPTFEYFRTGEGDGHIRIFEIGDPFVSFGEYESNVGLDKLREAKGAKKLSKAQEKRQYRIRTMTRAQFLAYLKDNKCKATTDDLLDPHAGYHPHDPHMHGGGFMGLFKGPSINDMFKGFSNIAHGVEHYFEKNSKLNASRFALKMGRTFGFPMDIMAQLQADEVSSMKEIIEKIQDKLGNLNGPVARNKALHIAKLTSSSAEEVGAAMLYMVKGYGHLYAEDIAHGQGSESFINGFIYSLGWRGAELTRMKRDARSKYLADLGSGSDGGEPTEEEMIWGLLKIIDGGAGREKSDPKYDPRFANAGAVVKAMGGPSGWEKAWRTEGIKNAYDKGIRQGGAVVNAEGRVNKGLSALRTFELNTAMGFMEKAAGKTPDPSIQTIPVVWALGGYSKYCSTDMQQKVKGYGDSQGHTFHAYAFLRNFEDNKTYTEVFIKALHDIDPNASKIAKSAINTIRIGPKNDNKATKDAYENAIDTLATIWKTHQGSGLHDHLQGKSTWIMKKINQQDQDVIKYAKRLAGIHQMNGGEKQVPNDNDWNVQYGLNTSGMFGDNKGGYAKEQDGKQVLTIAATLNKLPISGYELDKDAYDRLWPLVLGHFEKIEGEPDQVLQKAQYKQFREDVIKHFRNRMSIRAGGITAAVDEVQRKDYYKGLHYMGINAEELFVSTPISIGADIGYDRWRSRTGGRLPSGGGGGGGGGTPSVEDWVGKRTSKVLSPQRND